jgi:hypothetical protein
MQAPFMKEYSRELKDLKLLDSSYYSTACRGGCYKGDAIDLRRANSINPCDIRHQGFTVCCTVQNAVLSLQKRSAFFFCQQSEST